MAGGSYADLTPPAAGEVITRQWGLDVRDSVLTVHASAAARTAAIAAPTEGQITWLSDYNDLWVHNGTAWKPVAGPPTVYKAADETINNSAVLQDDADLAVSVAASAFYEGEVYIGFIANGAAGLKLDFTAPAGATMRCSSYLVVVGAATTLGTTGALGAVSGITATGAQLPYVGKFMLETAAAAGTLQFRWAQNAAHASDLTVYEGSYLRLRRVA